MIPTWKIARETYRETELTLNGLAPDLTITAYTSHPISEAVQGFLDLVSVGYPWDPCWGAPEAWAKKHRLNVDIAYTRHIWGSGTRHMSIVIREV